MKRIFRKVMLTVLAAALILGTMKYDVQASGMPGVTVFTYNGHLYQIISAADRSFTWNEAKQWCEEQGGHLLTVNSAAEQTFLMDLLFENNWCLEQYWIGAYRNSESDTWKWVTGEACSIDQDMTILNFSSDSAMRLAIMWGYVLWGYPDGSERLGLVCEWDGEGYLPEKDGWPICNAYTPFGKDSSYRIPLSRYLTVRGRWAGNYVKGLLDRFSAPGFCFGMSLLSAAQYNGQIDLSAYTAQSGDTLIEFGYDTVARTSDGKPYYSIAGNDRLISLIERAEVLQCSLLDLFQMEVFSNDSDYSELLAYLRSGDAKPIVAQMNDGEGHAIVIAGGVEPIDIDDGQFALLCYDPNNPRLEDDSWAYVDENPSYLLLDTTDGSWAYYDGEKKHDWHSYRFLTDIHLHFYDVSRCGFDFFDGELYDDIVMQYGQRLYFSLKENWTLKNRTGSTLFENQDGIGCLYSEDLRYLPFAGAAGDDDAQGMLYMTEGDYLIETSGSAQISTISDGIAAYYETDGVTSVEISDSKGSVKVVNTGASDTPFTLNVICAEGDGIAETSGMLESGKQLTITLDDSSENGYVRIETDSDPDQIDMNLTVDDQAVGLPAPETEADPEVETETEAEDVPETEAEDVAEPEPQPETETETEPETTAESEAESEPEPETEPEVAAEPETAKEPEIHGYNVQEYDKRDWKDKWNHQGPAAENRSGSEPNEEKGLRGRGWIQ